MKFIKEMKLTASQARELDHLGFVLKFVSISTADKDLYQVFAKEV